MKVLGCKVSDEVYDQFASFGCISDTLGKLVREFLVNQSKTTVNHTDSDR